MKFYVRILSLGFITAVSVLTVYILFLLSEKIVHYQNNFTRRFPHHLASQKAIVDLKFNSYYFAGTDGVNLYLGNSTTPLRLTAFNRSLQSRKIIPVKIDRRKSNLSAPHIKVVGNQFFVYEGSSALIYAGNIEAAQAKLKYADNIRFSLLEPVDSSLVGMRYFDPATGENVLGTARLDPSVNTFLSDKLLQKYTEGLFETDGMLRYDPISKLFVYVHLYKNEIIVTDESMQLRYRSKTIDTVAHANIKLAKTSQNVTKFTSKPLVVNKNIAVWNGLLFVNSQLAGKYEQDFMWQTTSIVDVYDLRNGSYRSSFYIDDIKRKKMDAFLVLDGHFYALIGNYLVDYKLKKDLYAGAKNL